MQIENFTRKHSLELENSIGLITEQFYDNLMNKINIANGCYFQSGGFNVIIQEKIDFET